MRIAFRADEGGFEADDDVLICGLTGADSAGTEHYLNFQRAPKADDAGEDWGVHLEFDDQGNSGYGCVRECRLGRDRLSVDLSKQLGSLVGIQGFDVVLEIDDAAYEQIRTGMPGIFRG